MKLLFFIILFILSIVIYSQNIFFNRNYLAPETYWTWGKSVLQTDNGYLACAIGSGYNGWTNKNVILCFTDEEGTPYEWKHYGETAYHYYPSGIGSLTHIEGKGYALPVGLEQGDCHLSRLFMFDYFGDTLWTRKYIDEESGDSCVMIFRNLIEGYNKDLIICGTQFGVESNNGDFMLLRTNSQGIKKWQKNFGTNETEELWSIAETPDNGLLLGGFSYIPGLDYSGDAVVTKMDYWGDIEWQKTLGGNLRDEVAAVTVAHDNNYIIGYGQAYYEPVPGYAHRVLTFLKLDQIGDTIWCRQYGDTLLGNNVREIMPLDDGNYMAMGTTQIDPNVISRGYLFKFTENGDSIWYKQYLHPLNIPMNLFEDFSQTSDGGYILCGGIFTEINPNPQQMWIMKVDSNGCDTCGTGVGIFPLKQNTPVSMYLYPNPAKNYLKVQFSLEDSPHIFSIFDIYGNKKDEITIQEGQPKLRIDLSNYIAGLYIVILRNNKEIVSHRKLIIVD